MHATLSIQSPGLLIASARALLNRESRGPSLTRWAKLLLAVAGGAAGHRGFIRTQLSSAVAAGYFDCVYGDAVLDTDTVTILGTALSYVTTPATTAEFNGDAGTAADGTPFAAASDSGVAYGLANAINGNATLNRYCRAFAVAGRCHIVCLYPSTLGNAITLAETGNGFTRSGANLTGGAADAAETYQCGYTPGATST